MIADRFQPLDPVRPGAPIRARDLKTAQTVVLRDRKLPDDDGGAALARAEAAKGVFHPSLVTLFDVVPQPDNRVLLAYEYVPAQSIAQVSGGQPFNARRAAAIVTEVADAIAELHAREIAHGGVSQTSVLITLKGKAKLDRVGDPTLHLMLLPEMSRDLVALADLLRELSGNRGSGGRSAMAIETIIERTRAGRIASAATLAGLLRRVGD